MATDDHAPLTPSRSVDGADATLGHHIVPTRIYYVIFGVLMLCTYLTVQIAFLDLGPLNTIAALVIAVFKATLVVLFFMHVRYSSKLTTAVVIGSIFWLGILLALTMADYLTRIWRTFG
jgi:cytochrome c oxidase subunit 4